jgi:hypothetical protein
MNNYFYAYEELFTVHFKIAFICINLIIGLIASAKILLLKMIDFFLIDRYLH